jgi:hypothetical protein
MAAAVALATVGFAGEAHIPKGMIFTSGSLSRIVASGWLPVVTRLTGSTTRVLGAKPKLHCSIAPLHTCCGIIAPQTKLICSLPRASQLNRRFSRVEQCIERGHGRDRSSGTGRFVSAPQTLS